MKRYLAILAIVPVLATACGGPNRTALAQKTVKTYWTDISHGKFAAAYQMLTAGNRQARPYDGYVTDMQGFMTSVAGLTVQAGKTTISNDTAVVAVTLHSPLTTVPKHAYQHLYWTGNTWQITDTDGGLSNKP